MTHWTAKAPERLPHIDAKLKNATVVATAPEPMVDEESPFVISARRDGWEPFRDKYGVLCWKDASDGMTWAGTAKQLCIAFDIGGQS